MRHAARPLWICGIFVSPLALAMGVVYAFILVGFALVWLDTIKPPVIGCLFYPVNWLINAVLFPHATRPTEIYGNGTAVFMVTVTYLFVYMLYRVGRATLVAMIRGRR